MANYVLEPVRAGPLVVVVHGEDFVEGVFVRIDVHHPAEIDWVKPAAGGVDDSSFILDASMRQP